MIAGMEDEREEFLSRRNQEARSFSIAGMESIYIERGEDEGRNESRASNQAGSEGAPETLMRANQLRRFCNTFQYAVQSIFILFLLTKMFVTIRLFLFFSVESTCHMPTFLFLVFALILDAFLLATNVYLVYKLLKRQFIEVNKVITIRFILQGYHSPPSNSL